MGNEAYTYATWQTEAELVESGRKWLSAENYDAVRQDLLDVLASANLFDTFSQERIADQFQSIPTTEGVRVFTEYLVDAGFNRLVDLQLRNGRFYFSSVAPDDITSSDYRFASYRDERKRNPQYFPDTREIEDPFTRTVFRIPSEVSEDQSPAQQVITTPLFYVIHQQGKKIGEVIVGARKMTKEAIQGHLKKLVTAIDIEKRYTDTIFRIVTTADLDTEIELQELQKEWKTMVGDLGEGYKDLQLAITTLPVWDAEIFEKVKDVYADDILQAYTRIAEKKLEPDPNNFFYSTDRVDASNVPFPTLLELFKSDYLTERAHVRILNPSEQLVAIDRIQRNPESSQQDKYSLFMSVCPWILSITGRYVPNNARLERGELIDIAYEAFEGAIKKYIPTTASWLTYLTEYVRGYILNEIQKNTGIGKIPQAPYYEYLRVKKRQESTVADGDLNSLEIAKVQAFLTGVYLFQPGAPYSENEIIGTQLSAEAQAVHDDQIAEIEYQERIARYLSWMRPKDRQILSLYSQDLTDKEIGLQMGLHEKSINHTRNSALKRLAVLRTIEDGKLIEGLSHRLTPLQYNLYLQIRNGSSSTEAANALNISVIKVVNIYTKAIFLTIEKLLSEEKST